jgi:hypothetical protein
MDEATIRQRAEAHGGAVVKGDMRSAGKDLSPEAVAQAPEVMKNLPKQLERATVIRIREEDSAYDTYISYEGPDSEVIVVSRWEERDGEPTITNLSLG